VQKPPKELNSSSIVEIALHVTSVYTIIMQYSNR